MSGGLTNYCPSVLDTVGWVIWPVKIVPSMTYNAFGWTLNPTLLLVTHWWRSYFGVEMMMMTMMKSSRLYAVCLTDAPFTIPVIDGRKATVNGDCLNGYVVANKPCCFDVNTRMVNAAAPLTVTIMCKILTVVLLCCCPWRKSLSLSSRTNLQVFVLVLGPQVLVLVLEQHKHKR